MTTSGMFNLTIGTFRLAIDIAIGRGQVVAVLGPNGAGKTTMLRAFAGLQPIDEGSIIVGGQVMDAPATHQFIEPEQRSVAMVFQEDLLFTHLSVSDNIAFGLRCQGLDSRAATVRANSWLTQFDLVEFGRAKPAQLSGGQARRVSLARALATEPQLVLLDEPFSALDAAARISVRRDLRRYLRRQETTTILVTHDPIDAIALADSVAIVESGTISQFGSLSEVTSRPRTDYVSDLLGTNLLRGVSSQSRVKLSAYRGEIATSTVASGPVFVRIHPHSVSLHREMPTGSARNIWAVRIVGFDFLGDRVRVRLKGDLSIIAEITTSSLTDLHLAEGDEVWAAVKTTEIEVYDD
ncbi:MAG: ABC transporter ATP-binding protein [Actinomycetes bacterium]